MDFNHSINSFVIENNELQNYSMNLVHYFLEKQNYSIFNFDEKILENFNHDYYNIVIVYTDPLYNDVNIETLIEKVSIIKSKLRKQFLVFNARLLVVATNCELKVDAIELPDYVDVIDANTLEKLFQNDIVKQIYGDIVNFPLNLSFEALTIRINMINIDYANKIKKIFNKKQFIVNIIIFGLIVLSMIGLYLQYDIRQFLGLTKEKLYNNEYYVLITNSFVEESLLAIVISGFILFNIGLKLERIYGSFRYLAILILTIVFCNVIPLAFVNREVYDLGFTPIIYGLMGSLIYVFLLFRRFLAKSIKRTILFIGIILITTILFMDELYIASIIGSLAGGFLASSVVGIPDVKNIQTKNRVLIFIFMMLVVMLSILIALKQF